MCGIFGVFQDEPDPERLSASARSIAHRGPDNTSIWRGKGIGLAHTRLSLLDLSPNSHQPFWDDSGKFVLIYNGEIYNFRELRAELAARGVAFRTTGDTEVLMALLVHAGVEETVAKLEGMFAFAFYDVESDTLTLARDRFGMKPIVYHASSERLIFASEVKALRPWIGLEPDMLSVAAFLDGHMGLASGFTLFQGVRILPPGSILRVRRHCQPEVTRFASISGFWDPAEHERLAGMPLQQLVDQLESLLRDSVRGQLLADAPVGVFCSGGVDSSLVISMAASMHSNLAIFHVDVVGRHSERQAAEELAKYLKLELRVIEVRDRDFIDALPTVIAHYERPITIRPESIPFLRVCQLAGEHGVKGVLSGEASDECFLGYQSMMPGIDSLWKWIPRPPIKNFKNGYKRIVQGRHAEFEHREQRADLGRALLTRFEDEMERACNQRLLDHNGAPIGVNDLKTLNALGFHLRTLLHRNDTLGMAAGIESRFPFLDRAVVRFAVNLPYQYKIRRTASVADVRHPFHRDKWIVREVAARRIPRALSHRPKRALPTNAFKRMSIMPEFFHDSYVASLLELDSRGVQFLCANTRRELQQRLLQLEVWARTCLGVSDIGETRQRLKRHVRIEQDRL